jgi:phosphoenolpyruvate phosphomutase
MRAHDLRAELHEDRLSFLMEAHNALSARIVEESRFEGIWASSLTIATTLGLRDCNEASWTQILDVVESMTDVTTLPILLDGDSGFGSYNNVRLLVRKLCQRGVAGISLADRPFPKLNSFVGDLQPLAAIDEFCGKIKAAKDSQTDDDFCVIARVEALVTGNSLNEALRRASSYRAAGADAILVHSKRPTPHEVIAFGRQWARRTPVLIVPTTYPAIRPEVIRASGISTVIWANHNLRAAISSMRHVCRQIRAAQSAIGAQRAIVSVGEVLELFDHAELLHADRLYGAGGYDRAHGHPTGA